MLAERSLCLSVDDILSAENFQLTATGESRYSLDTVGSLISADVPPHNPFRESQSSAGSGWNTNGHDGLEWTTALTRPNDDDLFHVPSEDVSSTSTAWTTTASATAKTTPATLISVSPMELHFDANLAPKHTLEIANVSKAQSILFKIKTPSKYRQHYVITPNKGVLRPLSALTISIEIPNHEAKRLIQTNTRQCTTTWAHPVKLELLKVHDDVYDQLECMEYDEQQQLHATLWAAADTWRLDEKMLTFHVKCTRLLFLEAGVSPLASPLHVTGTTNQFETCLHSLRLYSLESSAIVYLHNKASSPVAYKVLTTAPSRYRISPSFQLVPPKARAELRICFTRTFQSSARHLGGAVRLKDTLRIEAIVLTGLTPTVEVETRRSKDDIKRIVQSMWPTFDTDVKSMTYISCMVDLVVAAE
ncbi:hypothetical protein SDRG_05139 [Saprolegnia diclina VS20]|uniref:MSP domain-containing protein n=1 Tax=Saprolegnia diclina (strain VS20) TaxID=1156394 RepID=T0RYB6_SAPDV|nr:hypothetical protein SDRG_05139 [Saprolegnia diclina VS20]EQC37538.1 hypothetical protein SDRG_05139 [Saprolegnia diclina VS20]|eukprot:XP_008609058.1 hypothetical protein SDRG_05139 [Saprolegnia diclina VS20]